MIIFRYINGKVRPINVDVQESTNKYMNDKLRKVTLKSYIEKKEQEQQPLLQEFGYKSKEEKYRYKAQRLLDKFNRRNKK